MSMLPVFAAQLVAIETYASRTMSPIAIICIHVLFHIASVTAAVYAISASTLRGPQMRWWESRKPRI